MVTGKGVIAAIGNFDGVHLGHQRLLAETVAFATENAARPGALVFEPHPRRFFRPDDAPFLLTSPPAQRDALLRAHGAQEVMTLAFDEALAALSPEEFVRGVLKKKLGLDGVLTGADFRFGASRAGGGEILQRIGESAGLKVRLVDVLAQGPDTEKYGSSAVRAALREGNVKAAAKMLARAWSVRGCVIEGQKLGSTLGFPTANLTLGDIIEPRKGVYAVMVRVDGAMRKGVANFGRRPTVGSDAPLLEAHLFDFNGDLYGQEIDITFIDFIRDERKFDGLDALKAQIDKDCETARALLA